MNNKKNNYAKLLKEFENNTPSEFFKTAYVTTVQWYNTRQEFIPKGAWSVWEALQAAAQIRALREEGGEFEWAKGIHPFNSTRVVYPTLSKVNDVQGRIAHYEKKISDLLI